MTEVIAIKDLSWCYGDSEHRALDGVNLTLNSGEFVGIVGPNESGKTTLAAAMKGIIPQSFNGVYLGSVDLFGRPIVDYDAAECASLVGLVFSDPDAQFTTMSVEEEITFGLENIGLPIDVIGERLEWACELAGLQRLLTKSPFELSGGQKQRVAIAGVLAMEPEVLIMDEPTAGLDVAAREDVLDLLREYMEEKEERAILISSHISSDLEGLCDDLYMIHNGKIVLHEETDVLLGEYAVLKVDEEQYQTLDKQYILSRKKEAFGYQLLTNQKQFYLENYPKVVVENGTIDEAILMMIKGESV